MGRRTTVVAVFLRDSGATLILMMPPKSHPKWAELLQGRLEYKFSKAAASMLLFQLRCDLKRDPSPGALARATDELHAFCSKYERMLQDDLTTIFN